MRSFTGDRMFFFLTMALTLVGLAAFTSATLGLLAREHASISKDLLVQTGFGFGVGFIGLFFARSLSLASLKRYSFVIFGASLLITLAVFIPGVGVHSGGATRWISIGFTTIQPAELLKIGYILALAALLSTNAREIRSFRKGLVPFVILIGLPAIILLAQPNTSTTIVLALTGGLMYFSAGAPFRDFGLLLLGLILVLVLLVSFRPYVRDRVLTFFHPEARSLGAGYQIQQSLIAIGSGGFVGRGFGQGVEKFNYLPEPDGDSIFAVFAEETGFIGSVLLILLFFSLFARGVVIAGHARDLFGGLVALGASSLILIQTSINVGAMLGIIPLTGLPLPFVSHGGTAFVVMLFLCGLVLNVSSQSSR